MSGLSKSQRRFLLQVAVVSALALAALVSRELDRSGGASRPAHEGGTSAGTVTVEELFESRTSRVVVELAGRVRRLLADDNQGSRHQRFILELDSGHTVLVAHNIDLAPRAELSAGDLVEVRGQYEWNDRGGVIHWTHHDPQGRRPGGWLRTGEREYR
jgi:hypothetical protein